MACLYYLIFELKYKFFINNGIMLQQEEKEGYKILILLISGSIVSLFLYKSVLKNDLKRNRKYIPKNGINLNIVFGFLLSIIESCTGAIVFIFLLTFYNCLFKDVNKIFIVFFIISILDGIIVYIVNSLFLKMFSVGDNIISICENFIQFYLIYLTILQALGQFITSNNLNIRYENFKITEENMNLLILVFLISFISVLIGLFLYKLENNKIK